MAYEGMSASATQRVCPHTEEPSCGCVLHSSSVSQTLEELAFERGIWAAAVTGNAGKVECHLRGGTDANARDGSGYTALVGHFVYDSFVLCNVRIPAYAPLSLLSIMLRGMVTWLSVQCC